MGTSGAKTNLEREKIKSIFLESIKSLPEDQYLCPECDLVPEIINIDYIESEIDLECPKHGKKKIPIFEYFEKESQFIYTNAVCDIDYRTQKDNKDEIFTYCDKCKLNLCGLCSKKHSHKKSLIELKNKNSKCHHNENFTKFCKTCKIHLCEKEEQIHDKNHKIEDIIKPSNEEIQNIKDKKKHFENQMKNLEYIIKLFDTILNAYQFYKSNYYHNLNIINISQNIKNDEIIFLRNNNQKFEKLFIEIFNDKYKTDITGNEIYLDLRGKKIENEGLKMLSRINFKNLESLSLSRNGISNLEPLQDMKLSKLKKIDLSYNNITDISPLQEAIINMPRLVNIKLNNNLFQNVDIIKKGTFAKLEKISLENNKISKKNISIIKKLFEDKFKKISELFITYNNTKNNDKGIKIFDKKFISKNVELCKIYINEEEIELTEFYEPNKNDKYIKIKLIIEGEIKDMSYMFYNCTSLISVTDLSYWNTYSVTNMSYMFYNCINLKSLEVIASWDISNVTDVSYMFYNCQSIREIICFIDVCL